MRFGASFIVICIGVIGASLGAVGYLLLGLSVVEALATALTVASLPAAHHMFVGRAQERAEAMRQVTELSRGTAELAHQVKELGRRVIVAEADAARALEEARQATQPLADEIETLGQLVGQLAQSVAAHESALMFPPAHAAAPPPTYRPAPPAYAVPPAPPAAPVASTPAVPAAPEEDDDLLGSEDETVLVASVREAVEQNRVDLYLQSIVTLPQRKVKHYDAQVRLRTEDGEVLAPAEFAEAARQAGVTAVLDNLMVLRAVQVARRLAGKSKDALLCVAIAGETLSDEALFPELFDFLLRHRALAATLVLVLPQQAVRTMGPTEQESLARLMELGYRFGVDRMTSLELEPRRLSQQGFRLVKMPAALLLQHEEAAGLAIAPSDFSNLLARYGIDLVAEDVDADGTVADLLDYDVRFAQGTLFATPRPVRPDVLQPAGEPAAAAPPKPTETKKAAAPRRRESEDTAVPRPGAERSPQGLVKLARTIMRRA